MKKTLSKKIHLKRSLFGEIKEGFESLKSIRENGSVLPQPGSVNIPLKTNRKDTDSEDTMD